MTPSATPAPPRDARSEKVRRFRQLYLAGKLDRVLMTDDLAWDRLADAVFADLAPRYQDGTNREV